MTDLKEWLQKEQNQNKKQSKLIEEQNSKLDQNQK